MEGGKKANIIEEHPDEDDDDDEDEETKARRLIVVACFVESVSVMCTHLRCYKIYLILCVLLCMSYSKALFIISISHLIAPTDNSL